MLNKGSKKIAVSLAGIEAEVEWARGRPDDSKDSKVSYIEGPPTVSPSPLAVSAYFDAYNKSKGKRAIFFNVLDALTLVGTSLVPVTGPSFKDAQVFWSGGFVPGVHKAMGDISGQQLQNLTSLGRTSRPSRLGAALWRNIFTSKDTTRSTNR